MPSPRGNNSEFGAKDVVKDVNNQKMYWRLKVLVFWEWVRNKLIAMKYIQGK